MRTEHPPQPEGTPDGRASGARRRRPALVAVSVAAAVLLAGGGGVYWASTASNGGGGDGAPSADQGEPPPLKLDGYGKGGSGTEGPPGIAPGEPDPQGARYRADGPLPDGPDSASVYRAQADVTRAQAQRLAKALGVPGAPRPAGDTWRFGPTRDASGPMLDIGKKAPGTWTYARYGKGGAADCVEPPMTGPPKDGKRDGSSAFSPTRCPAAGDFPAGSDGGSSGDNGTGPVSELQAKRAAEPALKGIGLSDAKLDASRTIGDIRIVNANPVLGTLPTHGWQTGLQIGSDGRLVAGSGHLTELSKGPHYPVLGAAETLKLLNRSSGGGAVGIGGCASTVPLDGTKGADTPQAMPCPPADGSQPKPVVVPVREAVFGLAVHSVAGQQALVPSWMFEVAQPGVKGRHSTYTVAYPAVPEKYIAQSSPDGGTGPGDRSPAEPAEPGTTRMRIESYRTDDRTLILSFWGGVCSGYSASADTSAPGTVKVTVTGKERKPGQICITIAKRFEEKVTLDKPLGERTVVDATTGKAVPKKNRPAGPG